MLRNYFFLLETVIGLALLAVIGEFLLDRTGAYPGVAPHPYWIVVILIASRYGTLQGVLAGGLAAAAYIALGASSAQLDFASSTFPHDAYKMPFLFILVGGVIGEIRSMYKKRYAKLDDKYKENLNELQDLGLQYAALSESKHELDKKIAFQSSTLLSLFERLNNLEILEPQNIYTKIPDLLRDLLNVQCSSIYFIKNNKLRRYIRRGAKSESKIPKIVDLTHGMMGEVIRTKKVITVNQTYADADIVRHNEHDLIMSAPIMRKDQSIVGVINVEKLPFFDFNAHTVKVFEMFSYWISIVVDKALQFQQLKDKNIADEITGAYNYVHFQKRLAYEVARAKRFKTPLALLLLEVEKFDRMNAAETKNVLVVLNWIFSNLLREVDLIAKYKRDNIFAIILPGQSIPEAEIIISRIVSEINNYHLRPFDNQDELLQLNTGLSSLSIDGGTYDTLTQSAEQRLSGDRSEEDIYADLKYLVGSEAGGNEPGSSQPAETQ
ncbi:diguanylate cyclase [bacterium]|nr:diguanylate cyclase [bacterium]